MRLWQTVTVASAPGPRWASMIASGLPTMSLRPTMTTCWPAISMLLRIRSLLHAVGRAGQEPRAALDEPADVLGMKGVDVFGGADRVDDAAGVDLRRAAAAARGCRGRRRPC